MKKLLIVIITGCIVGALMTFMYYQFLLPYNSWSNYIGKNFYSKKVNQKEKFIVYAENEEIKINRFLILCSIKKIKKLPLLEVDCNNKEKNKND
jgi:uncharacterized membrane protein